MICLSGTRFTSPEAPAEMEENRWTRGKREEEEEKVHLFDNTVNMEEIRDSAEASDAHEDTQRPRQGKDMPRVPSAFVKSDDAKSPFIHNLLKEKDGGKTSGVEEEVTYTGKSGTGSRPTTTAIRSAATSSASEAPRSDTRRGPTVKSGGRGQEWRVKDEKPKKVKKEY